MMRDHLTCQCSGNGRQRARNEVTEKTRCSVNFRDCCANASNSRCSLGSNPGTVRQGLFLRLPDCLARCIKTQVKIRLSTVPTSRKCRMPMANKQRVSPPFSAPKLVKTVLGSDSKPPTLIYHKHLAQWIHGVPPFCITQRSRDLDLKQATCALWFLSNSMSWFLLPRNDVFLHKLGGMTHSLSGAVALGPADPSLFWLFDGRDLCRK